MTPDEKYTRPQDGGSYEMLKDGSFKRTDEPTKAPTDAEARAAMMKALGMVEAEPEATQDANAAKPAEVRRAKS